ncbi:MAG: chemotaxis protein, partial [Opitutaceae bacterium]
VIADLKGTVIANGRPAVYRSQSTNHREATWFKSALATGSGDEFGFQSVHVSPLVGNRRVLVYSCKICSGGDAKGKVVGVLGVVFNWDDLAQKIVRATPIEPEKKSLTRVCIVDETGEVLADTDERMLLEKLELPDRSEIFSRAKASALAMIEGKSTLVAHAQSPGFETYRTGWRSLVLERVAEA